MNLKEQTRQALAALPLFSGTAHTFELHAPEQHLRCELTALDSLACAFTELVLRSDRLTGKSTDELKQVAQNLSSKLTYLLEPISPIETDAEGCTVQMRSNPPQKEADRTSYYELIVARAGELRLVRYTRTPGQPREIVPAEVTREVLCRLVDDLSTALN
jgi:hypothetical protein